MGHVLNWIASFSVCVVNQKPLRICILMHLISLFHLKPCTLLITVLCRHARLCTVQAKSTRQHAKWNASARTKTMQLSSGLQQQVEFMCCSPAELELQQPMQSDATHPSICTCTRSSLLRFPSQLLYTLTSIRPSLRGEHFTNVLGVCGRLNCFYEL